jgi:hypothetical protein
LPLTQQHYDSLGICQVQSRCQNLYCGCNPFIATSSAANAQLCLSNMHKYRAHDGRTCRRRLCAVLAAGESPLPGLLNRACYTGMRTLSHPAQAQQAHLGLRPLPLPAWWSVHLDAATPLHTMMVRVRHDVVPAALTCCSIVLNRQSVHMVGRYQVDGATGKWPATWCKAAAYLHICLRQMSLRPAPNAPAYHGACLLVQLNPMANALSEYPQLPWQSQVHVAGLARHPPASAALCGLQDQIGWANS